MDSSKQEVAASRYRRVCLYGGPSVGKSTAAAHIFSVLKRTGHNTELVTEYVKSWAYQDRKPKSFDQVYLFAKQLHNEDRLMEHVSCVVTDSPLLLASVYARLQGHTFHAELERLAMLFETKYRGLHIFLRRDGKEYNPTGRYQTATQAEQLDSTIKQRLIDSRLHFVEFSYHNTGGIDSYVLDRLKEKP